MDFFQLADRYPGVDLRGLQLGVTEHRLNIADTGLVVRERQGLGKGIGDQYYRLEQPLPGGNLHPLKIIAFSLRTYQVAGPTHACVYFCQRFTRHVAMTGA